MLSEFIKPIMFLICLLKVPFPIISMCLHPLSSSDFHSTILMHLPSSTGHRGCLALTDLSRWSTHAPEWMGNLQQSHMPFPLHLGTPVGRVHSERTKGGPLHYPVYNLMKLNEYRHQNWDASPTLPLSTWMTLGKYLTILSPRFLSHKIEIISSRGC